LLQHRSTEEKRKNFAFEERFKAQFRVGAWNAFNTPAAPDTSLMQLGIRLSFQRVAGKGELRPVLRSIDTLRHGLYSCSQ